MLAIFGASGKIGKTISEILFNEGQQIKLISRTIEGIEEFIDKGIQYKTGNPANEDFLTDAFSGAEAVFVMTPPDYSAQSLRAHFNKLGQSIAEAIQQSGVKHVVNLSCMGANISKKVGPIKGLYDQELRLNTLMGINIVHLRPTYFMENILDNMDDNGIVSSSVKGDIKIPMIASADVAKIASKLLIKKNFSGKSVVEIYGRENISLDACVKILGTKTNKHDLKYEHRPYGKVFEDLQSQGMSEDSAHCLIELSRAINDGIIYKDLEKPYENNAGKTTFEQWANTVSI